MFSHLDPEEYDQVQKKAFTKWVNLHLMKAREGLGKREREREGGGGEREAVCENFVASVA